MPRYFFDLIDNGHSVPDDEGLEMADLAEARSQASIGLLEFLTQRAASMKTNDRLSTEQGNEAVDVAMLVRQDDGPILRVSAHFLVEELQ